MSNKRFHGVMPALYTPITDDNELKVDETRALLEKELAAGVHGFYLCGATGEGPLLPEKTRMRMAEVAREQVGRRTALIDHVGACDVKSAIRLARHAEEVGMDAISSVPPTFFVNYDEDAVFRYYRQLSESCNLPLLVYANAMFRQGDIVKFIDRVMQLPTVIGLKFTRYNYYEMRRIVELNGGDINVINGPDEMLICGLTMGADGGIGSTYNMMGPAFVKLYNAFTEGRFEDARQLQFRINRCIEIMLRHDGCMKQVLSEGGIDVGKPAFPGRVYTREEMRGIMDELNRVGYQELT